MKLLRPLGLPLPWWAVAAFLLPLSPASLLLRPSQAQARVARRAPDFPLHLADKTRSLRHFEGQPIVLLLADSPKSRLFRRQVRELEKSYDHFASQRVLFLAAFRQPSAAPVPSNIPFVLAAQGPATCEAYALKGSFAIALIGADGNLDYQTDHDLNATRIREVLQNSFTVQEAARAKMPEGQAP